MTASRIPVGAPPFPTLAMVVRRLGLALASGVLACRPTDPVPPPEREPRTAIEHADEDAAAEPLETDPRPPRPPATIYRSEIDRALRGGPAYLLRQLGPEPHRDGGRFVGWELTRLFPDDRSLCAQGCDIEIGDVIVAVAGNRLETPQALSALLEKLPDLETLEVRSLRDGKLRVVRYALVEDR